ncbi:hypothetical protein GCM10023322_81810 [Rugosimonospora acidiphila]|uniref:Acyltransferase 3 domain-containing protein n=1 Tax=Rugosimonospora acidiphila TaxID=556531 RepID=A0ABP9SVK2_9ACTN
MNPESAGPAAVARQRVQWADVAKGACIIFVVLWHVTVKHYLLIQWHLVLPVPGGWGKLSEQLLPLRMPLFFTISGVFATNAVARPWRVLVRSRIAKFFYIYAVWLFIHTAVLAAVPDFPTDRATSPLVLVEQLTITPSNLWYLFALAVYFAFAKAVRPVPRWLVLGAAVALSVIAAAELIPTPGDRGSVLQNLVWFLAGLYFRPLVERFAAGATNRRLAVTTAVYVVALGAMAAAGAEFWPGVWFLVSLAAVAFGVAAAARVGHWHAVADPLARLGRRTLPVYVIHMPALALLHLLLTGPLSRLGPLAQAPVALFYPIVLTALVIAASLAIHRGLMAAHATWLFALPGRRRAVRPAADPERTTDFGHLTGAGPAGGSDESTVVLPVVHQADRRPGPVAPGDPHRSTGSEDATVMLPVIR